MRFEIDEILQMLCDYYMVTPDFIFKNTRRGEVIRIRHLYYYLCCKFTKDTLTKIGSVKSRYTMGKSQHHATVLHARNKIKNYLEVDKSFRREYEDLMQYLDKHTKKPEIIKTDVDLLRICTKTTELQQNLNQLLL